MDEPAPAPRSDTAQPVIPQTPDARRFLSFVTDGASAAEEAAAGEGLDFGPTDPGPTEEQDEEVVLQLEHTARRRPTQGDT